MAISEQIPGLGGREPDQPRAEHEPKPRNLTLITGAGSGTGRLLARRLTGRLLARRLALEGIPVAAGIRQMNQFEDLQRITPGPDVILKPFFADLRNETQVEEAYRSLGLKEGQTIDFLPLAAAGFQTLMNRGTEVGKEFINTLVSLRKAARDQKLTREMAEKATEDLKRIATTPEAMALADETNSHAPTRLAKILVERGHINENSLVGMLSSDMSKRTNPSLTKVNDYPGPWIYYVVGRSKAEGTQEVRELTETAGGRFIDFTAPDITGTDVGKFFTDMQPVYDALQALVTTDKFELPTVSIGHVVNVMASELRKQDPSLPRTRDIWIPGNDRASSTMPEGWDKPLIPYL